MERAIGQTWRPRTCKTSPWTDDRIAHSKARWSQGAFARQISRELGNGISRSSVLGKIHRLGIIDRPSRGQAYAAAAERMKTALNDLCRLWGIGT